DREMTRDRLLLVPGIETVGLHADRDIEIESDLHAALVGKRLACGELPVGRPLHELDEFDLAPIGAAAKPGEILLIRLAPFGRPLPPRPREAMAQRLEAGEVRQQRAALVTELLETLAALGARIRPEILKSRSQRAPFQF